MKKGDRGTVKTPDTPASVQKHGDYQLELLDNQLALYADTPFTEDSNYLSEQLITYIGNKAPFWSKSAKRLCVSRNGSVRNVFVSSTHLAVPVLFHAF